MRRYLCYHLDSALSLSVASYSALFGYGKFSDFAKFRSRAARFKSSSWFDLEHAGRSSGG
jgi:hypothetical protein